MPGLNIIYRPENFEEVIGNKKTIFLLKTMLERDQGDIPHTILLQGESGCGKTTLARIISDQLGCIADKKNSDFVELDIAHFSGVDMAREVKNSTVYKPMSSKCRVWILDEFHKASTAFQSAMLKIFEDTPEFCYFILCTTDPTKLLKTIKNRCSAFEVQKTTDKESLQLIDWVLLSEGKTNVPDDVKKELIAISEGCPRQILITLDQIIDLPEENMMDYLSDNREENKKEIRDLCQALLKDSPWKKIANILRDLKGTEPETIRRATLGYMSAVLLNSGNAKAALIMDIFKEPVYNSGMPGIVLNCYEAME